MIDLSIVDKPFPPLTYEPRIWSVRIWTKGGGNGGYGFLFKAPYGHYQAIGAIILRGAATGQILRYTMGPASKRQTRAMDRKSLTRGFEALERAGLALGIDWTR